MLETSTIGNLWIIIAYNFPNQDVNFTEVFDSNHQNFFICGYFNSPHQELNCTYNAENDEKLLENIDDGNLKLLKNCYTTYQSHNIKARACMIYNSATSPSLIVLTFFR